MGQETVARGRRNSLSPGRLAEPASTAFAGFEAAAALGEEARHTRRSVPASIVGIVIISGVFYLLVACAEMFAAGRHGVGGFVARPSPLGLPDPPVLVAVGPVDHPAGDLPGRP